MSRTVSYTLVPVTSSECLNITVGRDGQGGLMAVGSFEIKDDQGGIRQYESTRVTLNASQRTSILNFVTSVLVPQLNTEQQL